MSKYAPGDDYVKAEFKVESSGEMTSPGTALLSGSAKESLYAIS